MLHHLDASSLCNYLNDLGCADPRRFSPVRNVYAFLVAIVIEFGVMVAPVGADALRPFTTYDLMRIEEFDEVAPSPDGKLIAYVLERPVTPTPRFWQHGNVDVWIASATPDGHSARLAPEDVAAGGFFAPKWSPTGRHLAVLSFANSDVLSLWIWEPDTGKLHKLKDGIHSEWGIVDYQWVGDEELSVYLTILGSPKGAFENNLGRFLKSAVTQWRQTLEGKEPSVATLDSGIPEKATANRALALVDLEGNTTVLSTAPVGEVRVAPDGSHIAFMTDVVARAFDTGKEFHWDRPFRDRFAATIVTTRTHDAYSPKALSHLADPASFKWSTDSKQFAVIATSSNTGGLVIQGGIDGRTRRIPMPDRDVRSLAWAEKALLIGAAQSSKETETGAPERFDWWMEQSPGRLQNITKSFKTAPQELRPVKGGRFIVGVVDGHVWRLDLATQSWADLMASFPKKFSENLRTREADPGQPIEQLVVQAEAGEVQTFRHDSDGQLFALNIATAALTPIVRPVDGSELFAYSIASGAAVFVERDGRGSSLVLVKGDRQHLLASSNEFLRHIAEGQTRAFSYVGLDGKNLTGWLLFPVGYRADRRYPVVAWMYPGFVNTKVAPPHVRTINNRDVFNLQLLSARGYAVLIPSMPLAPWGKGAHDNYLELANGVLPAVDQVIAFGVANPEQLAVMGHSYGGYAVYGLITQTSRFKAAIASAGVADLVSGYGTFNAGLAFEIDRGVDFVNWGWAETGQGALGQPPWLDWARYWRNSPLFYVDKVNTPLMIVQGDLDAPSVQQGMEFYNALYRQGKRARFVRYWGEGHTVSSPANIGDYWRQVYAWLDEFCDIQRDDSGEIIFEGMQTKPRTGAAALRPEDYRRFDRLRQASPDPSIHH
jgi:dipeptidyl aminopeptidase/acylaminoacyl peptidase